MSELAAALQRQRIIVDRNGLHFESVPRAAPVTQLVGGLQHTEAPRFRSGCGAPRLLGPLDGNGSSNVSATLPGNEEGSFEKDLERLLTTIGSDSDDTTIGAACAHSSDEDDGDDSDIDCEDFSGADDRVLASARKVHRAMKITAASKGYLANKGKAVDDNDEATNAKTYREHDFELLLLFPRLTVNEGLKIIQDLGNAMGFGGCPSAGSGQASGVGKWGSMLLLLSIPQMQQTDAMKYVKALAQERGAIAVTSPRRCVVLGPCLDFQAWVKKIQVSEPFEIEMRVCMPSHVAPQGESLCDMLKTDPLECDVGKHSHRTKATQSHPPPRQLRRRSSNEETRELQESLVSRIERELCEEKQKSERISLTTLASRVKTTRKTAAFQMAVEEVLENDVSLKAVLKFPPEPERKRGLDQSVTGAMKAMKSSARQEKL